MMMLTIKQGGVVEQYKMFHFEYAVLLEFFNMYHGRYTLKEKELIARDLCFFGAINYGELEFKLERV